MIYTVFGNKTASLVVSNGECSASASMVIPLDNTLKASFTAPGVVCPKDAVDFTNTSVGSVVSWIWDFGDGNSSFQQTPPSERFPFPGEADKVYTVTLTAQNGLGCRDTATQQIMALHTCIIAVPNAFTPNGDGINDYLYPLNAYKAVDLQFKVFNRYGQLVFETRDWTHKWDGTVGGIPQATGTYVWMLQYTDGETGKKYFLKGTSVLIR
jgi:gliding motility-associated-like protein